MKFQTHRTSARNKRTPRMRGQLPGHTRGQMNKTEARYSDLIEICRRHEVALDPSNDLPTPAAWWFEPMSLRLAKGVHWTPDFMILFTDGSVILIDVKGTRPRDQEAQKAKIKIAADRFPLFPFYIAREQPKKSGGGFKHEAI